ncbi:MAG: radical SAM protein [Candidatus Eisenbacteria bacterium]|nr:radical SAM protein [Candidatus Eisenbacteria bacterium]
MIGVVSRIPLYWCMRAFGRPRMLPLNLTVSVTYRCNSRCRTCNVYNKRAEEFTASEFDRVFASFGTTPYWFTMSGGEPFLRDDLPEICRSAHDRTRPGIINIPTNGILHDRIPGMVREICHGAPDTQVIVNLSLDDIGERHDAIRGVPGNFEKAVRTYEGLRGLGARNLAIGVHSVISVHNVDRIPEIYETIHRELAPDSFITEIAEERVELDTVGAGVTPSPEQYGRAVDYLIERIRAERHAGIARVTQAFRVRYYEMVKRYLASHRQIIPCYAGVASAQIAPDGDVWFCCIEAASVGNLREAGYDFPTVWFSPEARRLRGHVRRGECACPLANAGYTNMLMHLPTLSGAAFDLATGGSASRDEGGEA